MRLVWHAMEGHEVLPDVADKSWILRTGCAWICMGGTRWAGTMLTI